jgi:integrase
MKRKDKNGIVLRSGEYQRAENGTYRYKGKDADGNPVNLSADTLEELRELEALALRDKIDGVKNPGRLTLNELYTKWIAIKRGLRSNVFANYKYMYDRFCRDDIGTRKIKDIKRSDVRAFYNRLIDRGALAISTLEVIQNVLCQVFNLAYNDDIIRYNPAIGALKELKREAKTQKRTENPNAPRQPKKRHALKKKQQRAFLAWLKSSQYSTWYALFVVLLTTGIRIGELCALTWDDFDATRKEIHVNKTLVYYQDHEERKQKTTINTAKTESGVRVIPLVDDALDGILIQKLNNQRHPSRVNIDGYSNFIFLNRFGDNLNEAIVNRALRERILPAYNVYALEHNLPTIAQTTCHTFRHTYCVNCLAAGIDAKTVQTLMGHKDIETTLNIYAEASEEMIEAGTKSLAEFLET